MSLDDFILTCFCWVDEMLPCLTGDKRVRERGSNNLDGKRLASGSTDGRIRVWNVSDGSPQPVQDKAPQAAVIECAFALEDGAPVESNVQESIWLWEIPPAVATYHI